MCKLVEDAMQIIFSKPSLTSGAPLVKASRTKFPNVGSVGTVWETDKLVQATKVNEFDYRAWVPALIALLIRKLANDKAGFYPPTS